MLQSDAEFAFKPGQRWEYKTRLQDEGSTFVVVRIDNSARLGPIIHIYVEGLMLTNPFSTSGVNHIIPHLPFANEALKKCVTRLVEENLPLPNFVAPYKIWLEAFKAKNAGIYTIPLSEAINFTEISIRKQHRRPPQK